MTKVEVETHRIFSIEGTNFFSLIDFVIFIKRYRKKNIASVIFRTSGKMSGITGVVLVVRNNANSAETTIEHQHKAIEYIWTKWDKDAFSTNIPQKLPQFLLDTIALDLYGSYWHY